MRILESITFKTSSRLRLGLAAFMVVVLFLPACKNEKILKEGPIEYDADVAYAWIDLQMALTKGTAGFTPPVAARAYAYSGLAFYESMVYGMEGFQSMAGQISDYNEGMRPVVDSKKQYHWGLVANASFATMMRGLYPSTTDSLKGAITDLESQYNNSFASESNDQTYERSVTLGAEVANAILAYASTDGQSAAYTTNFPSSYIAPVGAGLWEPTPPAFSPALQPYWGNVRPFLSKNVSASVMPATPIPYSTDTASDFYAAMLEVYNTVNNRTPEQEVIANYWSDDPGKTATPSGHSISIMKQVCQMENAKLDLLAVAFAKTGMAVHDAFVCCWKSKYQYNYLRPVTAIRDLLDPAWSSLLVTPPFPEFTSGHSVQSGAACAVLTGMFGPNYAFTDRTHENRADIDGSPRSFTSFEDFTMEAAMSRLYGGIHYMEAIELGMSQGVSIGTNIHNLEFNK